jgi:hypothetical protein
METMTTSDSRSAASESLGPTVGPTYFSAFGVDERLIREALSTALSHGGEYADLFFQHRVAHNFVLEDGAVNRAFKGTELGVGVRVVKGDQTGYAFTEDRGRLAAKDPGPPPHDHRTSVALRDPAPLGRRPAGREAASPHRPQRQDVLDEPGDP